MLNGVGGQHAPQIGAASTAPVYSQAHGWLHTVSLADDPRPRASAGFAETARGVMQSLGLSAASAFASLKGSLTVAGDKLFDLAGKAAHGLMSGLKMLGREAAALFADRGPQAAPSGPRAAQGAPQAAGAGATAQPSRAAPRLPVELDALFTNLGIETFGGESFDPRTASVAQMHACTYAQVKASAEGMSDDKLGSFIRNANPASQSSQALARDYSAAVAGAVSARLEGKPPLPLSESGYRTDSSQHYTEMATETRPRGEIARQAVAELKAVLTELMGAPGDAASIRTAADRVPQDMRNQLGVMFAAIDDSGATPEQKAGMRAHAARDMLALRSINPELAVMKPPEGLSGDALTAFAHATPVRNRLEMGAAIQSLINGRGLPEKFAPEVRDLAGELGRDWGETFQTFARAVADGADPAVVGRARDAGQSKIDSFARNIAPHNAAVEQARRDDLRREYEENLAQAEWMS